MTTPTRLSRKRLEALIDFAERGLEDQAYNVREDAGIDLTETEADLSTQLREMDEDDIIFYEKSDLREMHERRRAAEAAIEILSRRLHPEWYEAAPQSGAGQGQS